MNKIFTSLKKFILIIYLIISLHSVISFAQPQISWVRKFGADTWDIPHVIKTDNLGNIFVTGFFGLTTNNGKTPVLKYNLLGDTLWTRIFNPPDNLNSSGSQLMLDDSLNIYISGRYILKYKQNGDLIYNRYYGCSTQTMSFDRNNNIIYGGRVIGSPYNPTLLKCNKNGDSLWKKEYPQYSQGNFGIESVNGIAVDKQNNIIMIGMLYHGPSTDRDFITIKFDPVGNVLWHVIYDGGAPGGGYDLPTRILLDSLDNIIVTGSSDGPSGGSNFYTVKYDPLGNVLWETRLSYDGAGSDDMKIDKNGFIYISGMTGSQYVTLKYNSLGQLQWSRIANGVGLQPASSLVLDSAGNIYVACNSYAAQNIDQYQILKYSNNGNLLWTVTYLGNPVYHCFTTAIDVDKLGNVFVTGECQIPATGYDFVTLKIDQTTGIIQIFSEIPKSYSLYQNYPNPFNPTTNINYDIPASGFVSLKVFDIIGKEIETLVNEKQTAGSYSISFNASTYPSGIYFYKLETNNFSETKKMLLIK